MMTISSFLTQLTTHPEKVSFDAFMKMIDEHFVFTPTAFDNGDLYNEAGENSGSCKVFSFARAYGLNKEETLACFGHYYRDEVLGQPEADNHQNIRHFIATGWAGISFKGEALINKEVLEENAK